MPPNTCVAKRKRGCKGKRTRGSATRRTTIPRATSIGMPSTTPSFLSLCPTTRAVKRRSAPSMTGSRDCMPTRSRRDTANLALKAPDNRLLTGLIAVRLAHPLNLLILLMFVQPPLHPQPATTSLRPRPSTLLLHLSYLPLLLPACLTTMTTITNLHHQRPSYTTIQMTKMPMPEGCTYLACKPLVKPQHSFHPRHHKSRRHSMLQLQLQLRHLSYHQRRSQHRSLA